MSYTLIKQNICPHESLITWYLRHSQLYPFVLAASTECQCQTVTLATPLHNSTMVSEFTNAWSEGDGERVLWCWNIFMLHFHAERRTKYALEALRLQLQLVTLSPDLVHQLTWGISQDVYQPTQVSKPWEIWRMDKEQSERLQHIQHNTGGNFVWHRTFIRGNLKCCVVS